MNTFRPLDNVQGFNILFGGTFNSKELLHNQSQQQNKTLKTYKLKIIFNSGQ